MQVVPRRPPQHDRAFTEPLARRRFREGWIRVVDANQDDATKRAGVPGEKGKRVALPPSPPRDRSTATAVGRRGGRESRPGRARWRRWARMSPLVRAGADAHQRAAHPVRPVPAGAQVPAATAQATEGQPAFAS